MNAPFTAKSIDLYMPHSRMQVNALGGETGLVPVLVDDGTAIWDTLAITEHLYERFPQVSLPKTPSIDSRSAPNHTMIDG